MTGTFRALLVPFVLALSLVIGATVATAPIASAQSSGGDSSGPAFEAGPEGTVRLGNRTCPVLGKPVNSSVGVAHNGWWINFCCPGCDAKLADDVDTHAAVLLRETGIDVRRAPHEYVRRPRRTFEAGTGGSTKLGNQICAGMGNPVKAGVTGVINGWEINFCCPGCDRIIRGAMDAKADILLAETGLDIRRKPEEYKAGTPVAFEEGPDGSVRLGNEKCPVMGRRVRRNVGKVYNGWWIGHCCGGCDSKLAADVDAFAGKLLGETGIDIRKAPIQYMHRPDRTAERGREGTVLLNNTWCPLKDKPIQKRYGFAHNGWWVYSCCRACRRRATRDIDGFANDLFIEVGIDIRKTPAEHGISR